MPNFGCLRFLYTDKPLVLCGIIKGINYITTKEELHENFIYS